jgi:uncharacterized membrane protein
MNDDALSPARRLAHERQRTRTGILFGLCAYGLWGVLPAYFKLIAAVSPFDIVAHRIVWSMLLLGLGIAILGRWSVVRDAFADRRSLRLLVLTATLIAGNWLLYVYAINSGHILAGSLGYYLNPLANILLGRFLLSERLTRLQCRRPVIHGPAAAVHRGRAPPSLFDRRHAAVPRADATVPVGRHGLWRAAEAGAHHRLRRDLDRAVPLRRKFDPPGPPNAIVRLTGTPYVPIMLNIVSILIGLLSLVLATVALLPLLGWANWLIIPLAVIGAGIGALSASKGGRNLNLAVIVIGILRLSLGGGLL